MCDRPALCCCGVLSALERIWTMGMRAHTCFAVACGSMPNSGVCSTLHECMPDQRVCLQDAGKVLAAEYGVPLEFIDVKTKKG